MAYAGLDDTGGGRLAETDRSFRSGLREPNRAHPRCFGDALDRPSCARRPVRGQLDRLPWIRRDRPVRDLGPRLAAGARGGVGPLLHGARRVPVPARRGAATIIVTRCAPARGRDGRPRRVGDHGDGTAAGVGRRRARGADRTRRLARGRRGSALRCPVPYLATTPVPRGRRGRTVAGVRTRHVVAEPPGSLRLRHHERHRPLLGPGRLRSCSRPALASRRSATARCRSVRPDLRGPRGGVSGTRVVRLAARGGRAQPHVVRACDRVATTSATPSRHGSSSPRSACSSLRLSVS